MQTQNGREINFALIFWEGDHSTDRDYINWKMGILPRKQQEWKMGTRPTEYRVKQRHEPEWFFRIFHRRYAVHVDFERLQKLHKVTTNEIKDVQQEILVNERRRSIAYTKLFDGTDSTIPYTETGPASATASVQGDDEADRDGDGEDDNDPQGSRMSIHLFHVRGSGHSLDDIHALEVQPRCSSLNSSDCFVAVRCRPSASPMVWMWVGKGSTLDEQEAAATIALSLRTYEGLESHTDVRVIEEGSGDWKYTAQSLYRALGGRTHFTSNDFLRTPRDERPSNQRYPRMFLCEDTYLDATRKLKVEAVNTFSQYYLQKSSIAIIDAHYTLFVWFGKDSSFRLQELGAKVVKNYGTRV
jgi:hypothetical protein